LTTSVRFAVCLFDDWLIDSAAFYCELRGKEIGFDKAGTGKVVVSVFILLRCRRVPSVHWLYGNGSVLYLFYLIRV